MTEPMNRSEAKQILVNAIGKECVFSIDGKVWNTGNLNANLMIDAMQGYAAQQVAAERERMKKDKNHLQWLYARLVSKHGENEHYDYMIKFKEIIDSL